MVNIPLDSGENQQKIHSQIKSMGEESKTSIRNIRRKFRKKDKDNDKQLQDITDQAIKEIDSLCVG